jgi:hypothetical protein
LALGNFLTASRSLFQQVLDFCGLQVPMSDVCDPQYPPVVVDLPKADAPKDAKPDLKPAKAAVGATQASVSGTGLDQVTAVQYGKTYLNFRLIPDADKKTVLSLSWPKGDLLGSPGIYNLIVTFADKTTVPCTLTIE